MFDANLFAEIVLAFAVDSVDLDFAWTTQRTTTIA
jgi:hypothetical protein